MGSWAGQILPPIPEHSFLIKDHIHHIHHIKALEVQVTVILPLSTWGVPQAGSSVLGTGSVPTRTSLSLAALGWMN